MIPVTPPNPPSKYRYNRQGENSGSSSRSHRRPSLTTQSSKDSTSTAHYTPSDLKKFVEQLDHSVDRRSETTSRSSSRLRRRRRNGNLRDASNSPPDFKSNQEGSQADFSSTDISPGEGGSHSREHGRTLPRIARILFPKRSLVDESGLSMEGLTSALPQPASDTSFLIPTLPSGSIDGACPVTRRRSRHKPSLSLDVPVRIQRAPTALATNTVAAENPLTETPQSVDLEDVDFALDRDMLERPLTPNVPSRVPGPLPSLRGRGTSAHASTRRYKSSRGIDKKRYGMCDFTSIGSIQRTRTPPDSHRRTRSVVSSRARDTRDIRVTAIGGRAAFPESIESRLGLGHFVNTSAPGPRDSQITDATSIEESSEHSQDGMMF